MAWLAFPSFLLPPLGATGRNNKSLGLCGRGKEGGRGRGGGGGGGEEGGHWEGTKMQHGFLYGQEESFSSFTAVTLSGTLPSRPGDAQSAEKVTGFFFILYYVVVV